MRCQKHHIGFCCMEHPWDAVPCFPSALVEAAWLWLLPEAKTMLIACLHVDEAQLLGLCWKLQARASAANSPQQTPGGGI